MFNRICITENWFKHLQNDVNQILKSVQQNDVNQILKSVHQIDVSF